MDYFRVKTRLKLLLLASLIPFSAAVCAQGDNVRISINRNKISIKEALQEVEKQSKMSVAYNESKLNGEKQISLNVSDQSLNETLGKILGDTGFSYQVQGEQIMIVSNKVAQSDKKTIKGKILDEENSPLAGATVSVKGTTLGTMTDSDGNYSLSVSKGDMLTVVYLGYVTQGIRVGDVSTIDVKLVPDSKELDAVVVTALGIKRSEKALSYNVQQISESDILKNKDANFMNALSGKIAGVNINSSSSGVGGASKVVMRGPKGIEQSSNALYVIDGIPMMNGGGSGGTEFSSRGSSEGIADINPEDIESISVLTGAAASALYGSDAANGVIVVNTKKGKAGRIAVTVSQTTEFLDPFVMPKFQNRYGTGSSLSTDPNTDRSWGNRLNESNQMGYSPKKDYFKTGMVNTENVSISTGSERNQTYMSVGSVNSRGMIPNNDYERLNFTFRNTTLFMKDKMTLDVGASYIKQKDQNMTNQGRYSNPLVSAYLVPRSVDWGEVKMYERYDSGRNMNTQYWPGWLSEFTGQNPYWINYRNMRVNKKDRYMLNASLSYDVLDWLNIGSRVRLDHSANDYTERFYATSNTTLTEGSPNGFYGKADSKDKQLYGDIMVNVNKNIAPDVSFQANVGASVQDKRYDMIEVRGPIDEEKGLANKFNLANMSKQYTERKEQPWHEQTQSLFASVELGYKGAYYLTLTARNDWPSQLAGMQVSQKSFFYPSVGTSFVLSEIFSLPKEISYLKLRGSFASVGIPIPRFLGMPVRLWDENAQQYKEYSNYPMPHFKPERTESWEVGLTARFLKNFSLDMSMYNTQSFNQTFDPQMSASSGYKKLYIQSGKVRNQGIELALTYSNQWKDFSWASTYTFSANRNKIQELVRNAVHPQTGAIINKDELDMGGLSQAHFILKEGGSLGDLYSLSDLHRDSNGNIYIDKNGALNTNSRAGYTKLGSVLPKSNMAWSNDFSWRGFNLSFMISARLGGIGYSATQAALDRYGVSEASAAARDQGYVLVNGGDRVSPEQWFGAIGGHDGIPQYYTYSATNVRLQEMRVGYTFSKKQLWGLGEATVSLVGRNLWMIYNKAPFDPESVATTGNYYQGIDNFMMPSTRNLGFNVRLKF